MRVYTFSVGRVRGGEKGRRKERYIDTVIEKKERKKKRTGEYFLVLRFHLSAFH